MKKLATILAVVMIFSTAMSVNASQRELDKQYEQIFAQNNDQKPTKQKAPEKSIAKKPRKSASDASNVKVDKIPTSTTTTQPAPQNEPKTTVRTQAVGGCENYRSIVSQYDWDVRVAMAVMQQESTNPQTGVSCDPNIANWSDDHSSWAGCMGSFGLFQINCSHGQVYDPAKNVAIAYSMYKARGWQPWTSYTSGEYAKYLR